MPIGTYGVLSSGGSFQRQNNIPASPGVGLHNAGRSGVPGLTGCSCLLVLVALLGIVSNARAVTYSNIFFTAFEKTNGYDARYELTGQKDWLRYPAVYGGNGLLTNFLGSQAAYIGFWPLDPLTNYLTIYREINYTPPANKTTLVRFSVSLDLEDSTDANGRYDQFWWTLYNGWDDPLFTVNFDNENLEVLYGLENQSDFINTGVRFTNGVLYELIITMDFANNRWSAILSNQVQVSTLATNLPITTTNTPLNFGSMDLAWVPNDPFHPGDNFLIFDNYRVTAEIHDPVTDSSRIELLARPTGGSLPMRVFGAEGARLAVDVSSNLQQWIPLKTNIVEGGSFDYVDIYSGASPRLFRARLVP